MVKHAEAEKSYQLNRYCATEMCKFTDKKLFEVNLHFSGSFLLVCIIIKQIKPHKTSVVSGNPLFRNYYARTE
jgi:hypothetical protein